MDKKNPPETKVIIASLSIPLAISDIQHSSSFKSIKYDPTLYNICYASCLLPFDSSISLVNSLAHQFQWGSRLSTWCIYILFPLNSRTSSLSFKAKINLEFSYHYNQCNWSQQITFYPPKILEDTWAHLVLVIILITSDIRYYEYH